MPELRAEIILDMDGNAVEEAEALFGQSLEIARRQEAKTFELRAATSLARLWQRQGKRAAARALLAPLYAWFTEGFATRAAGRQGTAGGDGLMKARLAPLRGSFLEASLGAA